MAARTSISLNREGIIGILNKQLWSSIYGSRESQKDRRINEFYLVKKCGSTDLDPLKLGSAQSCKDKVCI